MDFLAGVKMDSWHILRRGPQKPQLTALRPLITLSQLTLPDRWISKPVVRITLDLLTGPRTMEEEAPYGECDTL